MKFKLAFILPLILPVVVLTVTGFNGTDAEAQIAQASIQGNSPPTTSNQAAQSPALSSLPTQAIFLYGRANFFKALTKQLKCDEMDGALFRATNERFERARFRLASRYGESLFPADKPVNAPFRQGTCDAPTLRSYGVHVGEIEALLDKAR
jgi:hypothetical protein